MGGIRILKGDGGQDACCDGADQPIHIAIRRLDADESLALGLQPREGAVHVWQGGLTAGHTELPAGSSAILESGAQFSAKAGPQGTALVIPMGRFCSFTPGPDGLRFINYRNGPPESFAMKGGGTFDEAGYWQARVPSPQGAWI